MTEQLARSTIRKVSWHLMPLLCAVYVIAYIDRQNISFAKLQMVEDLGMSEAAYGFGAALFFIGYCIFEIPSNILLERVGARVWFARIMATWGAVTIALGFVSSPTSFYLLRFLLGIAEAGFFPGVLYTLTLWFPQQHRARGVGVFMIASAVANAVGAAVGGALLDLDGLAGLRGWQWVFVATGVPALIMAPVVLLFMPQGPAQARWLSPAEKRWLSQEVDNGAPVDRHASPLSALVDGRVLLLSACFFGFPMAAYGLSYWLPTIVRGFGVGNTANGLLNVIPWIAVGLTLWWVPRRAAAAPATQQHWYIIAPALLGALLLMVALLVPSNVVQFIALCLAAACIFSAQPTFWSLPSRFLHGSAAAAGFAAINSVGNLGGFAAQTLVPRVRDATNSDLAPMVLLAAALVVASILVLATFRRLPQPGE